MKPQWGTAFLAWERNGRRAYQFEDGRLRKIREGYYDLLEPVDEDETSVEHVRKNLLAALQSHRTGTVRKVLEAACTVEEQLALFTKLYPKGFKDPKWVDEKRGSTDGRSLKRHRVPSMQAAKEALDPS